jgi:LacI family transcriptional regulator
MGVKVKDLAKMLNVSPSTVSLVLNNRPGISDATRNKVKEAVRELGYEELLVPETEKKKNILFVVYRKHGKDASGTIYFSQLFSEIIEGAEAQARVKGCQLIISYIDQKNFGQEVERIRGERADGILLLATEMEEAQISAFLELEIPIVVLDNYIEQNQFDCVTMNNEQGVYEAVSHLVSCGHKEIGYLHVVRNANNFIERYFGYRRAMELQKVPLRQEWLIEIETEGGDALYAELKKKLEECRKLPTAFFADNDIVAITAIKVLKEMGYQVPEDVSMVGFDNMALSEMLEPPLTTIHIPKKTMGIAAVNSIMEKMQGENQAVFRTVAPTSLIVRQSVISRNEK